MTPLREGENYRIVLEGAVVVATVWRRPDLPSTAGAAAAAELAQELVTLAVKTRGGRALILDLQEAPAVAGPRTQESMAKVFAAWEKAGRRVVVAVGDPRQKLQFQRLVRDSAPSRGAVVESREEANEAVAR